MRAAIAKLARGFEPEMLPLSDATVLLDDVVAIKNVAALLEGRLARRVADAREWEGAGFPSAEAWLARQTGAPLGRAKETLQTAQRLEKLPEVTEAACAGDLSFDQLAVIADAATADPSAERRLLDSARQKPLSTLRDECAATKRAADPDPEAAHRRLHAARQLQFSRALDGAARLMGATTPEQMAVIKAAVERRGNDMFDQARSGGRREPREAYLMDALAQICDEWLRDQMGNPLVGTAQPPKRRPLSDGYLGLLRLDVEALQRGRVCGDETCEIAGLGPVPVSVARRLLGDAVLKLVLTRGKDVVNVTHLGRGPTVSQQIAMLWGSPGCAITGCPRMAGIEHDHRIAWRDTHHTVLEELDRLCDHHHDLKTYKCWALVRSPGSTIEMVPPADPRHPGGRRPDQPRAGPDPPTP